MRSGTLSFGEERVGYHIKRWSPTSYDQDFPWSSPWAQGYPEAIMIIGIWSNNSIFRYISIQISDLNKVISDLMVTTHAFYKIPEVEIIYYTPGQPSTQSHRLHPHEKNISNTTSSLTLLR